MEKMRIRLGMDMDKNIDPHKSKEIVVKEVKNKSGTILEQEIDSIHNGGIETIFYKGNNRLKNNVYHVELTIKQSNTNMKLTRANSEKFVNSNHTSNPLHTLKNIENITDYYCEVLHIHVEPKFYLGPRIEFNFWFSNTSDCSFFLSTHIINIIEATSIKSTPKQKELFYSTKIEKYSKIAKNEKRRPFKTAYQMVANYLKSKNVSKPSEQGFI